MSNLAVIDDNKKVTYQQQNNSLKNWEDDEFLTTVKEVFSKDLSPIEFKLFLEMGKALNLNPFLKEICAVKYGNTPAQIFIGRDGYRKAAQRDPDYEYHYCEAVYANDTFEAKEGIYDHQFNLKDRGALRGAFCKVKKKSSNRPFCLYVPFEEYNKGQSNWKTMPSTMIKKVAEAQCLRMAFQDTFSGTYSDSEDWEEVDTRKGASVESNKNSQPEYKKQLQPNFHKEKTEESKKIFNAVQEFESRKTSFLDQIEILCEQYVGKMDIDEEFKTSFSAEFFQYFKDEYIKSNGHANMQDLFEKKLTAKRINILAIRYNSLRDSQLSELELKEIKKSVYEDYMKDPTQSLMDVFSTKASEFIQF